MTDTIGEQARSFAAKAASNPATGALGRAMNDTPALDLLVTPTVTRLDATEFIKRTGTSQLGQDIETKLGAKAEAAFARIAARCDVTAAAASELLSRKSRWISTAIGLGVALAFNVTCPPLWAAPYVRP